MGQAKLKRSGGSPKFEEPKSQKRNWFKYLPHATVLAALAIGIYANRNTPTQTNPPQSIVSSPTISSLPAATISIVDRGLSTNTDANFSAVNSIVNSLVEQNPNSPCAFKVGPRSNLDDFLISVKNRFDSRGLRITANVTTPRAILESLNSYYLDNNYWFIIRSPEETNRTTGTSQRVVCIFRHPVVARSSLTYSYFGGNLHAENVPVYYLSGRAAFMEEGEGGGLTIRTGIMIFSETTLNPGQDRTLRNRDFAIHEGVHYFSLLQGDRDFIDHVDFDLNLVEGHNQTSESHLRDELRAFLIQMMYGSYPHDALDAVLMVDLAQYSFARTTMQDSIAHYLREHDPVRYNRFISGTLRRRDLSDDEVRTIAHDAFVRAGL